MRNAIAKSSIGFTLLELVIVLTVIGILFVSALPFYVDLRQEANRAITIVTLGAINSTLPIYNALNKQYPFQLDDAHPNSIASPTNNFFDSVLAMGGITSGNWHKGFSVSEHVAPNESTYILSVRRMYTAISCFKMMLFVLIKCIIMN